MMLGDNIKNIRLEKGFSQKYIAEKVGVTEAYISLIENNKRPNLGSELLEKLANALGVDIRDFYRDDEEDKDKQNKLAEQAKYIESIKLDSAEEAMKFILQQPSLMAFGGYDLNEMSEEEIMDLANDLLFAMKLSLEKMNRK